jgi:FMN phosphatase YigB (HAD superfamily)
VSPRIRHVLFDFGDTLAREPFCTIPWPGAPNFEADVLAAYAEDGLLDRWDVGEARLAEVALAVGRRSGLHPATAREALVHNWRHLRLNDTVLAFARELGREGRAAVVTVNTDAFTDVIAPHYGLHRDFAVVVVSCLERVRDKTALCELALARLGAPGAFPTALLVDNRADNVEAFRARGGQAYLFTDDATFARDLPALRARLDAAP